MRKFVDILLISVLISLMIFSGSLFIKVNRELDMQLEARDLIPEEDIGSTDVNLTEDNALDAYSNKYDTILYLDSGQAYTDETETSTNHIDNEYEIYEEYKIVKEEYESNIKKNQEKQEKIATGSFDPESSINNRGRIDRRQLVKSNEADLYTYTDLPVELLDWWDTVDKLFEKDIPVVVIDVETGKSFKAARTYGSNHADAETLTAEDTAVMKEIWGGEWNWERRAVIVLINGRKLAASASGMPHAGLDGIPEGENVENRSGDFGTGANLDRIKGNNMEGHFDIHFLNSRTHGTDKIDEMHQQMIQKASTHNNIERN
ncbi:MAG: hypothetical protein APF77_20275 [Clostridia bacterium BRH_c25]|nr:MAG: hypothetical protein APF77_20275 [Clostridia bacterium BRH_c25]